MTPNPVPAWHRLLDERDPSGLDAVLADDVVFHSPVVHTPQAGRILTRMYLAAAIHVLGRPDFRYVREIVGERDAVLEFTVEIDGVVVNGVDLIHWNDEGLIDDFKVMLRPLQAIDKVRQMMAAVLQNSA